MRETVLHLLQKSNGNYISGEEISKILGVSRAAVWKHIHALKTAGYTIEATRNRGYRLTSCPLSAGAIMPLLQTRALGRSLICLQTATSTNILARELALQGAPHGSALAAETQTAGRGRLQREWVDSPGKDICVSLILRPHIETQYAPRFTLATALGIHQLLRNMSIPATIKWPNDVLINGKKICGILLELNGTIDELAFVVVGIGINVNTASFPSDLSAVATSLCLLTGEQHGRASLFAMLLNTLEPLYDMCETADAYERLLSQYKQACSTIGQEVAVRSLQNEWQGTVQDIDERGQLLLRTPDGQIHALSAGDVTLRKD